MITLEKIDVQTIVFRRTDDEQSAHRYICDADKSTFRERFGYGDVKLCTPVEFDNGGDRWFAVYLANCFDPPIAIVRAEDEGDAIDAALYVCEWLRMEQATIDEIIADVRKELPADAHEDTVWDKVSEFIGMSDCGYYYDNESMSLFEVEPLAIYTTKERVNQ